MLKGINRPNGVFASVERLTMATYAACKTLKLNIPKKLKVISLSKLEIASLLKPGLSTLTKPAFEMGKETATLLLHQLEKKQAMMYQ